MTNTPRPRCTCGVECTEAPTRPVALIRGVDTSVLAEAWTCPGCGATWARDADDWDEDSICGEGCYFDPYEDGDTEESWHFKRTCGACGGVWWSLHCIHDGIQNPCPECGWRSPSSRTPMEALGFMQPPGETG